MNYIVIDVHVIITIYRDTYSLVYIRIIVITTSIMSFLHNIVTSFHWYYVANAVDSNI